MTFMNKLKSTAEELDLKGKANQVADAASKTAQQAREKACELADENRDKAGRVLDNAGAAIDERTEGKYALKVAKAKQQISKGVDKLAEQRPSKGDIPPTPTDPAI